MATTRALRLAGRITTLIGWYVLTLALGAVLIPLVILLALAIDRN